MGARGFAQILGWGGCAVAELTHSAIAITLNYEASMAKPLGVLHVNRCPAMHFVM